VNTFDWTGVWRATDRVRTSIVVTKALSPATAMSVLYMQTGELSTGMPKTVQVVDVSDRTAPRLVTTMPLPGAAWYGALTANGRELWVPGADNGLLTVFDLATNTVKRTVDLGNCLRHRRGDLPQGACVRHRQRDAHPTGRGRVDGAAHRRRRPRGGAAGGVDVSGVPAGRDPRLRHEDLHPARRPAAAAAVAFEPAVVDNAARFSAGKLRCTSDDFVWHPLLGCVAADPQ
jgi:hypothetical protein